MTARVDRLQRGLFEALSGVTDVVAWNRNDSPKVTGSLLSMAIVGGPTPRRRQHARGTLLLPADSLIVRVTAAIENQRIIIELNGFAFRHDVVGGDTIDSIRDALIVDIAEGEPGLDVDPDETDGIAIASSTLGGIRSLRLWGAVEVAEDELSLSASAVLERCGTVAFAIGLQAYGSKGNDARGEGHASNVIGRALERLQDPNVTDELTRWGVAIGSKGPISDISAVAGGRWESRATAPLECTLREVSVSPVESIESVGATIAIQVGEGTVTASAAVAAI